MLLKISHRQHAKFIFIDSFNPDTITVDNYTHFTDERGEAQTLTPPKEYGLSLALICLNTIIVLGTKWELKQHFLNQ